MGHGGNVNPAHNLKDASGSPPPEGRGTPSFIPNYFIKFSIPRPLAAGLPFKIWSRACPEI